MKKLKKIVYALDKTSDIFLMSCLGIMGLVLFMQVIARYVFKNPLIWSEEAARYLHVWITLFGIRFGLKNKAHLNVSYFYNKFSKKVQYLVRIGSNIFIMFCIGIYLPGALFFVKDQTLIVSSAMGVNMGFVYSPAIIGFIAAFIYLIVDTLEMAQNIFFPNNVLIKNTEAESNPLIKESL